MSKMKATKKLYSNIRKIFLVLMVLFPLLGLASCGDQHLHSYTYNNNETIHWQECSCGEKKNEEDHIFGDWITTKEPTISSVGSKKRVCGICQYEQIEALDPKEPEEKKGLEYSLNEDKKSYTVVGIGSATDETELVIPSTYQNLPVEQIAKDCFADNKNLKSVTLSKNIIYIDSRGFSNCLNIENVYYEGTIEDWCKISLGDDSSNPMSYANHFYLRNSNNEWEEVTSINIPNTITKIGTYQFYGFNNVTSITIPESVTSIEHGAFDGCSSLTSIVIPDSVTSIGYFAFENCSSLENVYYEGTIEDWCKISLGDDSSNPMSYANHFYLRNSNYEWEEVTSIDIPNTITKIGTYQFYGFNNVTSITIPDSVTSIGESAFSGCSNIIKATLPTIAISSIPKDKLQEVIITRGTSIGKSAFRDCSSLTSINISNSVISIEYGAFSGCSNIIKATLPTIAISSIPKDKLQEVIITGGTSIGQSAFRDCSSLTSVTIGNSVTSIEYGAFSGCSSLESITIPFVGESKDETSNTHFGYIFGASSYSSNASYVPSSLKEVIITGGTSIGSYAFEYCSRLTSIEIPNSVTSIGESAFYNCSSLTSIVIPEGVTSIEYGAFFECGSLTIITIPDSVTSIGYFAFRNCRSLTSIVIPDSVTIIGGYAFYNCRSLTSIVIPDSVTSIEYGAFYICRSLTNVTIGNSVTSIGYDAFSGCNLKEVYYTGTSTQWDAISIDSPNPALISATRYYYSETQPTSTGYYWHYVNGVPTKW